MPGNVTTQIIIMNSHTFIIDLTPDGIRIKKYSKLFYDGFRSLRPRNLPMELPLWTMATTKLFNPDISGYIRILKKISHKYTSITIWLEWRLWRSNGRYEVYHIWPCVIFYVSEGLLIVVIAYNYSAMTNN